MTAWLSIFMCLLLAAGQVTLAVDGSGARAACICSHCAQIQCCPCDSTPGPAPVSVPIPTANQLDVQFLMNPATMAFLSVPALDSATLLLDQHFAFVHAVHIYQRNCAYLI